MVPRTRLNRAGWLLAALFQLLLPAFASVADARAEGASASRGAAAHVERFGATGCPRVHPADCALCRVLAVGARASTPVVVTIPVARVIEAGPVELQDLRCIARASGDPPQRAPPV
jgi:hypothetical protein